MILETDFKSAVEELKFAIQLEALSLTAYGWSYEEVDNAPETFKDLKETTINQKILVANYGNDTSIYGKDVNIIFRFWHDVLHLENNLGFNTKDELIVASKHQEAAKIYNVSNLALKILEADTVGQVLYYDRHKEFVNNQTAFVQSCLHNGIRKATAFKH